MPPRLGDKSESIILRCQCSSLRHVVNLGYLDWGDEDEPELYIETLHQPCHPIWKRAVQAFKYVLGIGNLNFDASLIGVDDAAKLEAMVQKFRSEHADYMKRNFDY